MYIYIYIFSTLVNDFEKLICLYLDDMPVMSDIGTALLSLVSSSKRIFGTPAWDLDVTYTWSELGFRLFMLWI